MSYKRVWYEFPRVLTQTQRVITADGLGRVIGFEDPPLVLDVELDRPVSGNKCCRYGADEIALESNFSLVRVINTGGQLFSNAQNFPSPEECLAMAEQPYAQNETLLALNFGTRALESSNLAPIKISDYHLIEVYLDMYWPMKLQAYQDIEQAKKEWIKIDTLDGTTGHIFMCVLLDFCTGKILARALFTTMNVVRKDVWW